MQFDLGVSLVLLVAGVCALWTWRSVHSIGRSSTPVMRRVVMARQVIVILTAVVVAHSFLAWGTG